VATESLLERAVWSRRSPEFGSVFYRHSSSALVMEFRPTAHAESPEWKDLRETWVGFPSHPNLLQARGFRDDEWLLLRYAALDWHRAPLTADATDHERATFVAWGAQIIDVFELLATEVPKRSRGQLLRPFVKIDVGEAARVGFFPAIDRDLEISKQLPPEAIGATGRVDESAIVFAIGRLLLGVFPAIDGQAREIIDRCLEDIPKKRYRTVERLREAWMRMGGAQVVWEEEGPDSWSLAEEGVGWLALGNKSEARLKFDWSWELARSQLAREGRLLLTSLPSRSTSRSAAPPLEPRYAWADVAERARRFEAERAFADALALYSDVRLDGTNDLAINLAIARCQLALGVPGVALDYARRALAIDAQNVDALSIVSRAHLLRREPKDALGCADLWIAAHPQDASARYARGRALFALGRIEEARAAFDRACTLDPRMLEAMLLRREADRVMRRVRETVGTQPEIALDLPKHLSELRDAFAANRIADVLQVLGRPEYADDPVATLLRAQCLACEKRFDEAVTMFDRAATLSTEHERAAMIGKGHALLALDRVDEALASFDRACASAPTDLEAIDGRAATLRRLGRDDEAESELQRVVAASGGRSNVRLGRAPRPSRA
jgi:tetratricopeptide (TPR) repeat protein